MAPGRGSDVAESFYPGFSDPTRLVLQLPKANFILQALQGSQGRPLQFFLARYKSVTKIEETCPPQT